MNRVRTHDFIAQIVVNPTTIRSRPRRHNTQTDKQNILSINKIHLICNLPGSLISSNMKSSKMCKAVL